MAVEIPYGEPSEIRAGDTLSWLITDTDYPPADGWTLKYALRNAAQKINITAATSGTDYLVTVTRNTSKAFVPGRYDWTRYVAKGASPNDEQHTRATGGIDVLPDLSADVVYDNRSDTRRIYDSLIEAYKTYIADGGSGMASMSIAGKSVAFNKPKDFVDQIEIWRVKVADEEDAVNVANGQPSRRHVGIRFRRI